MTVTDLIDQSFGQLVVTGRCYKPRSNHAHWFCDCSCGKTNHVVRGSNLTSGNTVSCGDIERHPKTAWLADVRGTGMTFEEIAKELMITKAHARAIFERALRKLQNNIAVISALREHR